MKYTITYDDVLKWRKGNFKRQLRHIALNLLSFKTKVDKNFLGIQFLYFHHIYEDEIKNARKIIKWISNNFKVISYSEAIERIYNNNIDAYYICFSSDDGLKSNLIASEIFKEYNISCCFFINPQTIEIRDLEFYNKVCTQRLGVPLTELMTWTDVKKLIKDGHEIGNHSFDHKVQSELSKEEFIDDLKSSTILLKDKIGNVTHYAYPRGLFKYFKKQYLEMVYHYGYKSCATAVRGCHVNQLNNRKIREMAIRRDVIVFREPLSFTKYFMLNAQKNAHPNHTFWPHIN